MVLHLTHKLVTKTDNLHTNNFMRNGKTAKQKLLTVLTGDWTSSLPMQLLLSSSKQWCYFQIKSFKVLCTNAPPNTTKTIEK